MVDVNLIDQGAVLIIVDLNEIILFVIYLK